eukprot:1455913-Rhodomonas_salina.1
MQRMDFRNNNVNVTGNTLNLSLQIGAPRAQKERAVTPRWAHVQGLEDFVQEKVYEMKGLQKQLEQARAEVVARSKEVVAHSKEVDALRAQVTAMAKEIQAGEKARLQDWQRMTLFAGALALVL